MEKWIMRNAWKWDWRWMAVGLLLIAGPVFAQPVISAQTSESEGKALMMERDDVRSVLKAARHLGFEPNEADAQLSSDREGIIVPFEANELHQGNAVRGELYYHMNAPRLGTPVLIVGLAAKDDAGRAYFELQIPGGGVRFTAVGNEFEVTELTAASDDTNIATNIAGQVTTLAWDFGAIKHCFLSWLGIDNLSQLSGKIDAFCTLAPIAKDVLAIATHGSSCASAGVLSCVYFGLYLTKFLTCGTADIVSCVNGNPAPPADVTLTSGQPLSGQSVAKGQWRYYSINVPSGTATLTVNISGSGDADLYTRYGSKPTSGSYTCRPYIGGSNETCVQQNPAAGQWWIGIYGFESASYTVVATASNAGSGGDVQLSNNVPLSGQVIQQGQWKYYYISVPSGRAFLEVTITGTGDADLYTRFGSKPTASSYQCRPYAAGSSETCVHNAPAAGQWWIGVHGYSAATVTVKARY